MNESKMSNKGYILCCMLFISLSFSCSAVSTHLNSNTVIIDNVTYYLQEDYQCGPASLASVLNFWGVGVTPEKVAKEIFSKSARGTLTMDMLIYATRKGLYARQYTGSWHDLKTRIGDGYPLIILVDYGFLIYRDNHFMVVVGYNDEGVIVNCSIRGQTFIPKSRFLRSWERTNFWTLLIKGNE